MLQRSVGSTSPLWTKIADSPTNSMEQETSIHDVLAQLSQALGVLSNAPELLLVQESNEARPVPEQLAPNARIAEDSMHRLREFALTDTRLVTDLSQSLTILVLAADMLSEGQLSEADVHECYELLRRNAMQAKKSLRELHIQITGELSA